MEPPVNHSTAHKKDKYLNCKNVCEILSLNPCLEMVGVEPFDLEIRRVQVDLENISCCPLFLFDFSPKFHQFPV